MSCLVDLLTVYTIVTFWPLVKVGAVWETKPFARKFVVGVSWNVRVFPPWW
jgi:hypothetical protein